MRILFATLAMLCLAYSAFAQAPFQNAGRPLPPGVKALRDLEYARVGERALRLDLYLPEQAQEPLPLIIWIHGGGWQAGTKAIGPAHLQVLKYGFALASVEYRLSGEAIFPAQIEDCKAAVRWLRANARQYHLDPDALGAWGSSAGGHLVALLGTSGGVKELEGNLGNAEVSSRVQAVCDLCGPSDLLQMVGQPSSIDRRSANSPEARFLGGPISENKEKARQASPITYVSKDDPPFLIVHGSKDNVVPVNQSQLLYDALQADGVDATLRIVEGAGHGVNSPDVQRQALEFFQRHLKPAPAT
ncbi:MAG: prolyl oligopeptidase family serine peptidase [Armatimonadota bacterium]